MDAHGQPAGEGGARDPRVLLALAWALVLVALHWGSRGDDLGSLWVAGRLLLDGRSDLLYSHHASNLAWVDDPTWQAIRDNLDRYVPLHPYFYPPLFARAVADWTAVVPFSVAARGALVLNALSMALVALLAVRLCHPRPTLGKWAFATILAALTLSEPVRYALELGQTTPWVLALVLGAVTLGRSRPLAAGGLLALATAVKLLPAVVVVLWLLERRHRAVAGFLAGLALLAAASLALGGVGPNLAWLSTVKALGGLTLAAYNNQGLCGWITGLGVGPEAALHFDIYPVPPGFRLWGPALVLLGMGAVALRGRREPGWTVAALLLLPPLLSNLSWTHYYLSLIPALLVLARRARERRDGMAWVGVGLIGALNLRPLAPDSLAPVLTASTFAHSHLLSGALAMVALFVVGPGEKEPS